jgi:light-regulated signal transduction histidine kinase (bacteriophytochrome)/CheY-like chemotaxis protein
MMLQPDRKHLYRQINERRRPVCPLQFSRLRARAAFFVSLKECSHDQGAHRRLHTRLGVLTELVSDHSGVTDCDREPIHVPGQIQPHGFLLAFTPDQMVSSVSANIGDFTGVAAADWLGHSIRGLIDREAMHGLMNRITALHGPDAIERIFALPLFANKPPLDVAVHRVGTLVVVECEAAITDEREAAALVRAMVARLKHAEGLMAFFRDGARHVQALTGFDRVMVYRFDAEGHGEVVGEALRGSKDSYMGLHYPASDIPVQARALYLRNPFRIIVDVAATPVPIRSRSEAGDEPLDQTLSVLRAVSPVHIQYLKNMGVAASLSISIIVDGKLWGLFACHHRAARLPSLAYRTAAELFGEMYSMMLEGRLRREAAEHELRDRALAALLVAENEQNDQLLTDASRLGELIFDTIPADGVSVLAEGLVWSDGITPDKARCRAIASKLSKREKRDVFSTDQLGTWLGDASSDSEAPAGCVAIPLMLGSADYLLLFRRERLRTLQWAGNPEKPLHAEDGVLSPRQSFTAWSQLVEGKCEPFTVAQVRAAETIRVALMEAALRALGGAARSEPPMRSGQDMLIAELNHRVRNILALVHGLISQTRSSTETADNFIITLDDRVQSLARAHNQVTSDRWGPARLKDLIETETGAYLEAAGNRVHITGPNVLIQPAAFTTLALVFHELLTNAAKYGALSDSGVVTLSWVIEDEGDLLLDWLESGGPVVALPSRRGFGSTIIERSIAYDLGGSAQVDFAPEGFTAQFRIPARHIAGLSAMEATPLIPPPSLIDSSLLAGTCVLLLEDSMIIAMDCADTLQELGATKVITASTVREALAAIASHTFQFALLDFNLNNETSVEVADALSTLGVPFAFATGYDGDIQSKGHANAPVVGKPYGKKQLIPMLVGLGFGLDTSLVASPMIKQ